MAGPGVAGPGVAVGVAGTECSGVAGVGDGRRLLAKNGRSMSAQAMQSLYELRQNNLLCDAVLRLEDGGVFSVHRAILSACSTYFR